MRTRKHRGSIAAAALIATGMAASVVLSGSDASTAAPVTSPDFYNATDANYEASQMGQRLVGDLKGAAGFAGVRIVPSGIEVDTVGAPVRNMLTTVSGDLGTYLGLPIPITYRSVTRSQSLLDGIDAQITADQSSWAARGVSLSAWGVDPTSNTVLIKLAKYSGHAADLLTALYGDGVSVYPADFPVQASSRTNDTTPWYGADDLAVVNGRCTSWFSLVSTVSGATYNATAGHCGVGNVYVYGTRLYQGDVPPGAQHWVDGGSVDAELYQVTSNRGIVWADPTTGYRSVTSRSTANVPGTLLCFDGETDREVCSVRIVGPASVTYDGKTVHNQVYAVQINGKAACSAGDSGGPVYAGKNGSLEAQAFGMIVAYTDPAHCFYTPSQNIFDAFPNATFQPL